MDDLYQNAWSEITHDTPSTFKADSRPSWSSPSKIPTPYDEEADLSAPSWSTGADIRWDEPSGSPGFSWSQSDADAGWGPTTYEGITLRKPQLEFAEEFQEVSHTHEGQRELEVLSGHAHEEARDKSTEPVQEVNDYVPLAASPVEGVSSLPSSPVQPSVPSPTFLPREHVSPTLPTSISIPLAESVVIQTYDIAPELAPSSPDGFGTFESALGDDAPEFNVHNADADPWGASAWDDAKPNASEEEPVMDEWERARRQKAKQDRHVPPEMLAQILAQTEELTRKIFPMTQESQTSQTDEWKNDRRSGIEGVPGLNAFFNDFLPPLSLQPLARFSQTQLTKKMASSVKLTKNLLITRGSPMSHYLAAQGSTAWETSVKERKEVIEDDIPVGWRIVEKAPAVPTTDTTKKTGGLFSFWGRRQSQIVTNASTSPDSETRPSSSEKPRSPVTSSESRRPSQDSMRSSRTDSVMQLPSPLKEPTPVETVPVTAMSSYSTTSDPIAEHSNSHPAPSAVSRFLNRFSRRGGGSPRSSLALSSDDLEFLSDIVPSAHDDTDEDALERFVNAKQEKELVAPVPILPPPLAPPPKAPPLRPDNAASIVRNAAGSKSGSSAGVLSSDFDMLFGSTDSVSLISPPSNISPSSLFSSGGSTGLSTSSSTPGAEPSNFSSMPAFSLHSSARPPSRLQTSTPPLVGFSLPPPPAAAPIAPSVAAKPKPSLSSPFPLPPPPAASQGDAGPTSASSTSSQMSYRTAAEDSPPSPTSTLPLGKLYPHLTSPALRPQLSAQPFLEGKNMPHGSLTTETPLASAFPNSANHIPLLQGPVQPQSVNSPSPWTSNTLDDDDFADFQSPTEQHSSTIFPVPAPIFKSPPTLSDVVRTVTSESRAPPTSSTYNDDDDFSDFHSPPLHNSLQLSSSTSLFSDTLSDDKALLTPRNITSSFSFNDDLFGSSLATPSPPRLPAKPAPPLHPPALQPAAKIGAALKPPPLQPPPTQLTRIVPPVQPPYLFQRPPTQPKHASIGPLTSSGGTGSSLLSRRRSQAAEHLHTLNLVEKAASKQGQRWPAPLSPLPAAIPGPNGVSPSPAVLFDIMDNEELPTASQQPWMASPPLPQTLNLMRPSSGLSTIGGVHSHGAPTSSSLPPSSVTNVGTPATDAFDTWNVGRTASPPNGIKTALGSGVAAKQANKGLVGGLSAQDLSFFEGL